MNPTLDIYIGSPVEISSEKVFLERLAADLRKRGRGGLIFANFFPPRSPHQIDFLIVLEQCVCHVELKHYTAPIVGQENGPWSLIQPDGSACTLEKKNPFRQALDQKYALSDAMHALASKDKSLPKPAEKAKFFQCFDSIVCVFPELHVKSKVPSDRRVRVMGYLELLEFLDRPRLSPSWTEQHWLAFAMVLGLERQDEQENFDSEQAAAKDAIQGYVKRFREAYRSGLHALIPTTVHVDGAEIRSDDLTSFLSLGRHGQLIGPSGCGKSHLARHIALSVIERDHVPIFISAKHYEGRLSQLINRSVAPFHPNTAIHLLFAASKTAANTSMIIDGFNECPEALRRSFLDDLQAFYLRWPMPILFTSQERIDTPEALSGQIAKFSDPSSSQRQDLLRSYLSVDMDQQMESLFEPFRTAFELSIAAQCFLDLPAQPTRADLFDAYIRRACASLQHCAIVRRILREIALVLGKQLLTAITQTQVWRLAEQVVESESGSLDAIYELPDCRLLEISQGRVSFRHELLGCYLEAEAFQAKLGHDPAAIGTSLSSPRFRHLGQFIVAMQSDEQGTRACLEALADSSLIVKSIRGELGSIACEVARKDAEATVAAGQRDLADTEVKVTEGSTVFDSVTVVSPRQLSGYESALCNALGVVVSDGILLDEVIRLIEDTEVYCRMRIESEQINREATRSRTTTGLFASLFVFSPVGGDRSPPAAVIVRAMHNEFRTSCNPAVLERILTSRGNLEEQPSSVAYVLCHLLRRGSVHCASVLPAVLRACWHSGIYHVQLEGLQLAQSYAFLPPGPIREEIEGILCGIDTKNLFLSTTLVEALLAYGLLESPVTTSEASDQITRALAQPDNPESCVLAYTVVTNVFEEIFQGAYDMAIEALTHKERVKLFAMAAVGAPDHGWSVDWILAELLRLADAEALPAFRHWASVISVDSNCIQFATACYLYGIIGCAMFQETPPLLLRTPNDAHKAWECYGQILFWNAKQGTGSDPAREACKNAWERLGSELRFEAVDPLMRMWDATRSSNNELHSYVKNLLVGNSDVIRGIVEFGLANKDRLSTVFRHPIPFHDEERVRVLIQILGEIGNRGTVAKLEAYRDSPTLGAAATSAIRQIRSRIP